MLWDYLKKQRPMPTEVVAKAMIVAAKQGVSGIFETTDIGTWPSKHRMRI